jgi:hypothetical protein
MGRGKGVVQYIWGGNMLIYYLLDWLVTTWKDQFTFNYVGHDLLIVK